jgi:protein-L-isoaspartate O-methyltransferase
VLEAFELKKDDPITFLNVGSGSGYLTCIAASILGPRSVHYCVEIHEDVVEHAKNAVNAWKEAYPPGRKIQNIEFFHGNALEMNTDEGECAFGFDRIYIGAAVETTHLNIFKKVLKPGGILIGPGT